jgi:CheY-like chemotaxis protein
MLINKNILIVEDNQLNKKIISYWFSKYGYLFSFADCGEDALELYIKEYYEIIIMDLLLPGINGFETAKKIREISSNQYNKQPYIIALTANTLDNDRIKCLQAGMDEYMSKPINFKLMDELLNNINSDNG